MRELNGDSVRPDLALLALVVGNTSTRIGAFEGRRLVRSERRPNSDLEGLVDSLIESARALPQASSTALVVASDNDPVADALCARAGPQLELEIYRVGADLEVPIERALDADANPGKDRLLNGLAAWDAMQQACVVVDAGTALTIDFIDGAGTFQGGAIAPGARMMLDAMHERTSALPEVSLAQPGDGAFGKSTSQSMLHGVFWGIRGMVRHLVERYAEAYEAYPPVIATGSDAPLLFDGDELIDRLEPELTLRGVECACRLALAPDEGSGT